MEMKIAAVTDDGQKISSHFGMAPLYRVYTIREGRVIAAENREKPHHQHHPDHAAGHRHEGHGHTDMFAPLADCQVLLCGGMGTPAYQKANTAGLEVYLVGGEIMQALQAYLDGNLSSDLRRVHQH